MDKNSTYPDLTLEEQLIIIVDKYIEKRYRKDDKDFTHQIYLLFVGYHLKYFYQKDTYTTSIRGIDNIMEMFTASYKCLTSHFIRNLKNTEIVFIQLNSLVKYIEENQDKTEEIYTMIKAQYEMKLIERELVHEAGNVRHHRL